MFSTFAFILFLISLNYNQNIDVNELPHIPEQIGAWNITPAIIVCNNSNVTLNQVKKSYASFGVNINPQTTGNCDCSLVNFQVRFLPSYCARQWTKHDNELGLTMINYLDTSRTLISVGVSIVENNNIVLAHEVGHSLGWMHSSDSNNLMYPYYYLMTSSNFVGVN